MNRNFRGWVKIVPELARKKKREGLWIRLSIRDFTWSILVVNSGQHCDCDYCQEIVKIVQELARKKEKIRESSGRADLSEANTITRPHAVDQT